MNYIRLLKLYVTTDAPIFIYIHGGYWQALDKTISAYAVRPLVEAAIKVIVLEYDLCPYITLEQLVDQIQRAGIFIVNYANSIGSKYGKSNFLNNLFYLTHITFILFSLIHSFYIRAILLRRNFF